MKKVLLAIILSALAIVLFVPGESEVYPAALKAKDTDGTPSDEILQHMLSGHEPVILKYFPFGYLEVEEWEKVILPKKVFAIVDWKTYKDLGAGNIYIGYSFDGKEYKEIGPFNESDGTQTVLEVPVNIFSDISNLRIRFRGEDLDFATDAVAEVSIKLKVIRYKFGLIEWP
jgi:hypothetical protein